MYVFFTERQSECPKLAADILRKIENHFARSARRIRIVKNREKGTATVPPLRNAGASLSAQRFGRNRRQLPDFSPCRMLLAPPFGTKRWCQKHPPGETAGDRPSSAPKTLRSKLAPAFSTAHPPPVLLPDFSRGGDFGLRMAGRGRLSDEFSGCRLSPAVQGGGFFGCPSGGKGGARNQAPPRG